MDVLYAQEVIPYRVERDLGTWCEGDSVEFGVDLGISCFKRKIGVCSAPFPDIAEDNSEAIEIVGTNGRRSELGGYYVGTNLAFIKTWKFKIRAEFTGEFYVIARCPVEVVVGTTCPSNPPTNYVNEFIYTFKIRTIPKPPTPFLSVDRYISEGSVKFKASGCPTTIPGYDYAWNTALCDANATNTYFPGNKDGTNDGVGGVNYRVICSANYGQCRREPSQFERGITYTRPDNNCIPDNIKGQIYKYKIENIRKSSDLSYHRYSVETEICDLSSDSNCSVASVFELMNSRNKFITPIPSDSRRWISRPFVDRLYPEKDIPVKSCWVVDLPGLAGEAQLKDDISVLTLPWSLIKEHRNPVMTYIDASNYITINYTLNEHIFSPGRVIRMIMQKCSKVYVYTIGEGLSDAEHSWMVAWINETFGEDAFKNIDLRLKNKYQEVYHP